MMASCGSRPLRAPEARPSYALNAAAGSTSWEAVLPGPAVTEVALAAGPEAARRNDALSYRPYDAVAALDSWPERTQPELSRWRRLYLPRDARSIIYFEQGTREHRHPSYSRDRYDHAPRYDRYGRGGHH